MLFVRSVVSVYEDYDTIRHDLNRDTVKIQSDHNLHLQLYWNNQIRDLLFWVKPTVCRSLRVLGFSKRVLKHQIIICISFTTHCHILVHTKHRVQQCSAWRSFECVINFCAFQTKYCVFRADTQLDSTVIHDNHTVLRCHYWLCTIFLAPTLLPYDTYLC